MMMNHTCAKGGGGSGGMLPLKNVGKNGAVWCNLSVPELVIIDLKTTFLGIINQQPKFCAIFFSKINPDARFCTK